MYRFAVGRLERAAVAAVAVAVLLLMAAANFLHHSPNPGIAQASDSVLAQFRSFETSRQGGGAMERHGKAVPHMAVRLRAFNPNTADSATLVSLGLRPRQARAVVNYRKAGGVFRRREDFRRIYCIDDAVYSRLAPYMSVPQEAVEKPAVVPHAEHGPAKLREGETVDLNCKDTALLKRVPGVGSVTARRIVEYGERLGGYVSAEQAAEVYGLGRDAVKWFVAGSAAVEKINLNTATFAQLIHHPYINRAQTRAVLVARKKWGRIHSLNSLKADSAFTPRDFRRLAPYVEF